MWSKKRRESMADEEGRELRKGSLFVVRYEMKGWGREGERGLRDGKGKKGYPGM